MPATHGLTLTFLFHSCGRWTNPSQDLIICQHCQAVVAIAFHPLLKSEDEVRIANTYKEKLCTSHKVTCPFHANAFPTTDTIIPSYLGSVLPVETMQLFEQPNPRSLLQKHVKQLENTVGNEQKPLALDLSPKQMEEFLQEGESVEMFVSRVSEALDCGDGNEWATVLALFCWEPLECRQATSKAVQLQCPVCLAQRGLPLQSESEQVSDEDDSSADEVRPAKKRRAVDGLLRMNPITSHRHYCPVICGFAQQDSSFSSPMWETIATNLLQATETTNENIEEIMPEDAMMKIHRLLRAGLGK